MNNTMNKEEYQYLANKTKKIDNERTKTFCVHALGAATGSIAIELLSNSDIISSLYFGGALYFSSKNFLKPDLFYYPLINHSLYLKSLSEYKIVTERIASSLEKINNHNPAFIAGIYHTLLTRKDFSYNRYQSNTSNQNQYFLLPNKDKGMFLINGYYTNMYIPFHFKELLTKMNITNATIPVLFKDNVYKNGVDEINSEEKIIIPKEINNLDEVLFPNIFGNYQLNIIKEKNKEQVYYFDIINEIFLNKANNKTLQLPNTPILKLAGYPKKDYILPIKFLGNKIYSTEENTYVNIKLLKYMDVSNIESMVNYKEGKNYVIDNDEYFEKLYLANQINYKEINNNLTNLEEIAKEYNKTQKVKTKSLRK